MEKIACNTNVQVNLSVRLKIPVTADFAIPALPASEASWFVLLNFVAGFCADLQNLGPVISPDSEGQTCVGAHQDIQPGKLMHFVVLTS